MALYSHPVRVAVLAAIACCVNAAHLEPSAVFVTKHKGVAVHFEGFMRELVPLVGYHRAGYGSAHVEKLEESIGV